MLKYLKFIADDRVLIFLFKLSIILIILFGVFCRIKLYLTQAPLWYDETALSLSYLNKKILDIGLFNHLELGQKAPPLFSVLVHLTTKIAGYNLLTLRFIPFISGVLSLPAFYLLLKNNLKTRTAILMGLFIFSINPMLIYYCGEVKQYSSDVFICICLLICFKYIKLDKDSLTTSKTFLYGLISVVLLLFSFPCIFIIPSIVFVKTFEEKYINKKCLIIALGLILTCAYLYFSDKDICRWLFEVYGRDNGGSFLEFNINSLLHLGNYYLNFIVYNFHNIKVIPLLVLILSGFILFIKENNKIYLLFVSILMLTVLTSLCRLYPMFNRLILFFTPMLFLCISKVFDYKIITRLGKIILIGIIFYVLSLYYLPYINIQSQKMIYCMPLEEREYFKTVICKTLNDYNGEAILIDECTAAFFKTYLKIYNINKEVNYILYYTDDNKSEFINFIDANNDNKGKWIIGNQLPGFENPVEMKFIEAELKKRNIKYEKQYYDGKNNFVFYLYKILN